MTIVVFFTVGRLLTAPPNRRGEDTGRSEVVERAGVAVLSSGFFNIIQAGLPLLDA